MQAYRPRLLVFGLLLLCNAAALAQSGFMRNISASGLVMDDGSNVLAQIACTIVDQGSIGLIIFAEATSSGTDPLLILTVQQNGQLVPTDDNDDWVNLPAADRNDISNILRSPNASTDAALIGVVEPGAYCAFAFQDGPQDVGSINLQLTDVSEAFATKALELPTFEPIDDPELQSLIERATRGLPDLP